ncbi:MAG: hypothetical protein WDZ59_14355 [Pirellulales bacterium]
MVDVLRQFIRPLTSQAFDVRMAQLSCWLAAGMVLVLGFFKLTQLPLNETEWFFGVLLVLTVGLLATLIGMVLPIAAKCKVPRDN